MPYTLEQLQAIMPNGKARITNFLDALNETVEKYDLDTPPRLQIFIAQLAHESGELRYVKELASGQAYEGRRDLGNVQVGDGVKYKGRGLIQITGRTNYKALSDAFGVDFVTSPELLEQPKYAALSAGWFWNSRSLNKYADVGDFLMITKRINGGTNGLADRQMYWERAKKAIV